MLVRAAALLIVAIAAGCGSASDSPSQNAASPSGTIESLWRAPGEDVGLIQGTGDYAPGKVRVSFLIVRSDGRAVERARARIWLAAGMKSKPFLETTAALEPIGLPGEPAIVGDVRSLYVTHVDVPRPGRFWLLAEPVGGEPVQGLGTLVVKEREASPAVGARAVPSRTPTIASTGGNLKLLTTATPPDRALLRHSVADSLAARKPFVVAFATPEFCTSRTCGPTVDVVDHVRRKLEPTDVRFIHVEIFASNDPQKGVNRWVKEWNLPSEPWVFVVGRDGRIKEKFEGSVSVSELERAVQAIA